MKKYLKKVLIVTLCLCTIIGGTNISDPVMSDALTKKIVLYGKTKTSLKTNLSYLQAYKGEIFKVNFSEADMIYQPELLRYKKKPVVKPYKLCESQYYVKLGHYTGYIKVANNYYRKATLWYVAPVKRLPKKVNGKYVYVIDKTTDKGLLSNKYFKNTCYIVDEKQMETCNSSAYIIGQSKFNKAAIWSPKAKNALSFVKRNTITKAKMTYW